MTNITRNATKRKLTGTFLALTGLAVVGAGLTLGTSDKLRASTAMTTPVVATQASPIPHMPVNIADVVERVSPAVVSVKVTHSAGNSTNGVESAPFNEFFERFFDDETRRRFGDQFRAPRVPEARQQPVQGVGSGFVIDKAGYIVTNHHVIDGAEKIEIEFKDGMKRQAKIVGTDPKTDLALLKVDVKADLHVVPFGRSQDMRVGDWVLTMGNPFGLSQTATTGIVSARHRNIGAGPFDDFLQIDAAINQGNSGGPAFNLKGEVIGVNTAIFSPSGGNVGIGFAIPSKLAAKIVADLRENGRIERGWLGVHIQGVTDDLAAGLQLDDVRGALVSQVTADSPAAKAGLKSGDVILSVDGHSVTAVRGLPTLVADLKPGRAARFGIWRQGAEKSIEVIIGKAPDRNQIAAVPASKADVSGLELATLTPQTRRHFQLDGSTQGVVITAVKPNSAAARNGLTRGDVIVAVGHQQVRTPGDVANKIRDAKKLSRKAVLLLVNRDSNERFVALSLRDA